MPRRQKEGRVLTKLGADLEAIREIIWHSLDMTWFEYPSGARLNFFCWPVKYRSLARDGVPVFFVEAGPTIMQTQPPIKNEEHRAVLRKKVKKVFDKIYLIIPYQLTRFDL